jgi:hypothetical protein
MTRRYAPGRAPAVAGGVAQRSNEQVGGGDSRGRSGRPLRPGRPAARYEVEHASERPDLVARALAALRNAKGFAA